VNPHHHKNEPQQHQSFLNLPQKEVQDAAGDEHQEHRFTDDVTGDRKNVAAAGRGQFIVTLFRDAPGGFLPGKCDQ